jgi:hypothetical protein
MDGVAHAPVRPAVLRIRSDHAQRFFDGRRPAVHQRAKTFAYVVKALVPRRKAKAEHFSLDTHSFHILLYAPAAQRHPFPAVLPFFPAGSPLRPRQRHIGARVETCLFAIIYNLLYESRFAFMILLKVKNRNDFVESRARRRKPRKKVFIIYKNKPCIVGK